MKKEENRLKQEYQKTNDPFGREEEEKVEVKKKRKYIEKERAKAL